MPQILLEAGKKSFFTQNTLQCLNLRSPHYQQSIQKLKSTQSCVVQGLTHPLPLWMPEHSIFGPKTVSYPPFRWIPQGTPQVMAATSKSQLLPIFSYSLVKDSQSFLIRVKCPFPWGKSFLVNVSRQNKIKDITLRLKWLYPNQIILQVSCFEPPKGWLIGQQLRLFWVFLLH